MKQILFHLPITFGGALPNGIPVYGFGMMLLIAFFLCSWMAGRRAEREGVAKVHIENLTLWIFIGGLIGARTVFMLGEHGWHGLRDFLVNFPRIWDGGIVLYGSVVGAVVAVVVAMRVQFRQLGLTMPQLADILAPAIAVGVCLGRVGCLLNGCCYGEPVCAECAVVPVHFPLSAPPRFALTDAGFQTAAGFTLDLEQPNAGARVGRVTPGSPAHAAGLRDGDVIVEAEGRDIKSAEDLGRALSYSRWPRGENTLSLRVVPAGAEAPVSPVFRPATIGIHPTQVYESISMLIVFALLTAYYPFRTRRGEVIALLMICYAAHRFLNEMLRGDPRPEGFESLGSAVLLGAGLWLWVWLRTRPAEFRPEWRTS